MYSKTILVGNLTRDIEVRYAQSGTPIASTGIATNRKWKTQSGEQKEEVMFIDITLFGRTAEIANQYLRKGSKVLIEGRLVLEQWTAQDGSKRSKHSIVVETLKMLDSHNQEHQPQQQSPKEQSPTPVAPQGNNPQQSQQGQQQDAPTNEEDEIPF